MNRPAERPRDTRGLPLDGLRVLGNTYTWAGPYAAMMLADLGAEVILIESTQHWQWNTRGYIPRPSREVIRGMGTTGGSYVDKEPGDRPWNRNGLFNSHARNKLGMTVDLTLPDGVELFKRLVSASDAVIENGTPGIMHKLGVGYEDLVKVKPDLVMVSSAGMGGSGPYTEQRGFGSQFEDISGFGWLRSYPDRDLADAPSTTHSDAAAGAAMVFACVAAIHNRDRTGRGQWVDMSQVENLIPQIASAVMDFTMNGRVRGPIGNRHPSMAPHGAYPCLGDDRWVAISVATDGQWSALRQAMGDPEWSRDPALDIAIGRWKRQDEIDPKITEWTRRHAPEEIMHLLQAVGVPAGAVMNDGDLWGDPHLWARGFFRLMTQADSGTHWYPGPVWQLSETPVEFRLPPVALGEHNEYVYQGLLGVDAEGYAALESEGHVGMDFAPHIA